MTGLRAGLVALVLGVGAGGQGPEVAPGLAIPRGGIPWALDSVGGKQELVPVHHSTVVLDNHRGSNLAKGMVFGKQKMNTQLDGLHAATHLHTDRPVFFVPVGEDDVSPDAPAQSKNAETTNWAIVQASPEKDHRVMQVVTFTTVTNNAKRKEGVIEVDSTRMPNGLLKLTPKEPMAEGEYAIVPLTHTPNTFATVVYDFGIDKSSPENSDVVKPE